MTLIATLAVAMVAFPVNAQPRGGSHGGGGYSRGSGSSSHSSMSSSYRGGSSRSSASSSRSYSSSSSRSYSAPTRSSSAQSRSYSSPSRSNSTQSRSYSTPNRSNGSVTRNNGAVTRSNGSATRSSGAVQQRTPSQTNGAAVRNNGPVNRNSGSAVTRSGGTATRGGSVQPRTPSGTNGAAVRNNGPVTRSGNPSQPRTARSQPGQTRSFDGGHQPNHVRTHPNPGHDIQRHHPRHREPMPFNRPSRFWDRGPHFFGHRVHFLPPRYVVRYYWGVPYYIVDGLYYRCYNDFYYVCRPPFGVFFDPVIDVAGAICHFAYYSSVYNTFRTINENAATITAQNEIIAQNNATIAQQNSEMALNTERAISAQKAADNLGLVQSFADAQVEYYYDDGVFFTKDADGKYITIVPPAGALVQELPDDYDTININGGEYYKVDDTVYRTTIVDGAAYFEVLGQMTGDLASQYDLYK